MCWTTTGPSTLPTFTMMGRWGLHLHLHLHLHLRQVRLCMKQDAEEQIPEYDDIFR